MIDTGVLRGALPTCRQRAAGAYKLAPNELILQGEPIVLLQSELTDLRSYIIESTMPLSKDFILIDLVSISFCPGLSGVR